MIDYSLGFAAGSDLARAYSCLTPNKTPVRVRDRSIKWSEHQKDDAFLTLPLPPIAVIAWYCHRHGRVRSVTKPRRLSTI
jgi:hypothetical protein